MSHGDDLQKAHNDGQTDESNGVYNPPNSFISVLGSFVNPLSPPSDIEEKGEENKSYDEGWNHAKSQEGGCFLSAACVEHAGLSDGCRELTTLRSFRDGYVVLRRLSGESNKV